MYTRETLQGMDLTHLQRDLFNQPVFSDLTRVELSKLLLMVYVMFPFNSVIVPGELRIEEGVKRFLIPPVVYAHFLRFLCHYHLFNVRQCQDSLRDLQLTIEKKYCIANCYQGAISYNILGITFQLLGDKESVRQAFMQSLELEPDSNKNDASRRLELIGKTTS